MTAAGRDIGSADGAGAGEPDARAAPCSEARGAVPAESAVDALRVPGEAFAGSVPARMTVRPTSAEVTLGALLGKGALDPAARALIDARALVWLPGWFPSFGAPEHYVRLRTVVGNRVGALTAGGAPAHAAAGHGAATASAARPITPPSGASDAVASDPGAAGSMDALRAVQPAVAPASLSNVRCGVDAGDGKRCGRSLWRETRPSEPGAYVTPAGCHQEGHGFRVEAEHLVDAVISVLATTYAPAMMRDAVLNAKARADARRARLAVLAAEVVRLDKAYGRLARLEEDVLLRAESPRYETAARAQPGAGASPSDDASAAAADDYDVRFYRERRRDIQRRRDAAQAERVALTAALAERGRGAEDEAAHLAAVEGLAAHVGPLLAAVRADPELLRPLLGALTVAVSVAPAAPHLLVVDVALPNGGARRRLLATGAVRSAQPARVWAAARLAAGDAAPAVEARLVRAGAGRGLLRGDGREAYQQALLHHYFESELGAPVPRAETRPYEAVAATVGVSADAVLDAALRGALGPASAVSGGYLLAPTDAELEAAFPDYARARVAARTGWPLEETVLVTSAAARLGVPPSTLDRARRRFARDATRRCYVRWTTLPPDLLASAPAGAPDHETVYARAVAQAVAGGGFDRASADDWHSLELLLAHLRRRGTLGGRRELSVAMRDGHVARVSYVGPPPHPGERKPRMFAYCPAAVHGSDDRTVVQAWLRGAWPAPRALPDAERPGR